MGRIPRSDELITTAYFLSKYTEIVDVGSKKIKTKPPNEFGIDGWKELYEVLFPILGAGRTLKTFSSSLYNSRDEFDKVTGQIARIGHKKDELPPKMKAFHENLKRYSREELWAVVSQNLSSDDFELAHEFGMKPNSKEFKEGKERIREHKEKERNNTLVLHAKNHWNMMSNGDIKCEVCGFSFLQQYGEIGQGFIEAHHRKPLHEIKNEISNTIEDLAPVCANCHRILHRHKPMISVLEFKNMYMSGKFGPQ